MKEYKIGDNEQGQRFDKLLAKILKEANKGFIYKMLRKKNITLNGKKASGNEMLCKGDNVKIFLSDETFEKFAGVSSTDNNFNNVLNNQHYKKVKLDIIEETKDYMLINKPVGMLSQKAKDTDISLVEHIIDYMLERGQITKEQLQTFKPSVCNRLDRNTSGLIIAGKSLIGLQKMTEYIKNREVDKYYLALVKGNIDKKSVIEGYLHKDIKTNKVTIYKDVNQLHKEKMNQNKRVDNTKKMAINNLEYIKTEYENIATNGEYTLLKVKLITGKTHQIRAHLASINHPLVGDYKYGDKKLNEYFKEKYGLQSQFLHSYELVFCNKDEDVLKVKGKTYKALFDGVFMDIINDMFNIKL